MSAKEIKQHALSQLMRESDLLLDDRQRAYVQESLHTYEEFGYIEAPGADHVPFQDKADIPFGAILVFMWFLIENGEDYVTVVAELDKGYGDIVSTFGKGMEEL